MKIKKICGCKKEDFYWEIFGGKRVKWLEKFLDLGRKGGKLLKLNVWGYWKMNFFLKILKSKNLSSHLINFVEILGGGS